MFNANCGPKIQPLHIHAVTAEECCARPRIREPFAMMSTVPGVRCTSGLDNGYPTLHGDGIMIQQRFRTLDYGCQKLNLDAGWLIVAELDDDPAALFIDPAELDRQYRIVRKGHQIADIYGWLRAVHAVQVSTEPLAEIVREFNPNVMVFPNQIAELPAWEEKKHDHVVLFYGAQNRQDDWKPIMPALNRVLAEPSKMTWVHVIHDEEFYRALEIPGSQKFFTPFCEYAKYREILRSCDIALLPLEPGRFNECKSDLKFLECAAEGVVAICGKPVYVETALTGWNALVHDGTHEFEIDLRWMIEEPAKRREIAEHAYAYVRDHRLLSQHYKARLDWYRSLIAIREHLQFQLLDRCPELRRTQAEPALLQPAP